MHVELEADSLNSLFCSTSQSLYQKLTRRIKIKMQFKDKEEHLTYTQETKLIIKKKVYTLQVSFWCPSVHILTNPLSEFNGRCKLDHSCWD